jgi:phosphoribosylformimino-5-aminoimidazole carboxamide ribotide isomerase
MIELLPAIDVHEGKCVRLLQGDFGRRFEYDEDPVSVACGFRNAGARWLQVVDLDGARSGHPMNLEIIRQIVDRTLLPVQAGGGVRDHEAVKELLDCGVSRVIIGTGAMERWEWFANLVRQPELAERIALALDAREGMLMTHGWARQSSRSAVAVAEAVTGWPLAAIVYRDVGRDGMLLGPNLDAIRAVALHGQMPVIATGGVADLNDIRLLAQLPIAGIVVGRALYEGTVRLEEAIKLLDELSPS